MGGAGRRYDLAVLKFAILCAAGVCGFSENANAQYAVVGPPAPGGGPYVGTPYVGAPYASAPYNNNANLTPSSSAPTPNATNFRINTGVTVGETYNDNVNLAPNGAARSDFVTTVQPNLTAAGQGARVNFGLTYDPELLYYAKGTAPTRVQQFLQGAGNAEIYPEILYTDAYASVTQGYLNGAGPISTSTTSSNSNLQTVQNYSVSPYLRHHFGSYADSESRYRFTSVIVGGDTVAPVQIHEARQLVTSGDYFSRLGWTLTGDATWYDRGETPADPASNISSTDKYGRADLKYLIYEGLSALAGVGYETLHDPTLLEQPKGVIWDGGFQYQPTPYANVSFTYGRRFRNTDYEFNGEYDIGPSLKVLSSYTQTYQTGLTLVAANGSQLTVNQNGQVINSQTGLPVTNSPFGIATSSPFGISNQAFFDKRFQTTVLATRGRNTYSVTGFEDQASGAAVSSGVSGTNGSARTYGGGVNWTRQLWPNLASNLGGQYNDITYQDGSGRRDTLYIINAGLTYTFSPTLTGQLYFSRFSRQSNIALDSLDNDILTVSLQKQF